ncbi:hypothetical protein IQ268_24485 [Oculatella sp. LEGE 06141]|uniref:hypothetical protein n=1 Tax=Oculatella sp. LEGE 06141 TaxID=1828648 RepID=UPI0018830C05|nr:hypothetical protein [Oculatella sp. LEGE 06141]MBE9181728.1 hypothetical protein [Oculatella sp. LEGE 06141]
MAFLTQRCDWLNLALFRREFWVSGLAQTAEKYQTQGAITLRFVGHFPGHMQPPQTLAVPDRRLWLPSHYDLLMGFLAVELPNQWAVNQFVPSEPLQQLSLRVQQRFEVPVAIVAFAAEPPPAVENPFFVIDAALNFSGLVAPQHYAQQINQSRNPLAWDEPLVKPINQSINDTFQRWTRTYLSGQFSINDIDALKTINTPSGQEILVLCELKRSQIDFKRWTPYLNDVPNFMLTKACARKCFSAIDIVIHYHAKTTDQVAVHFITNVTKQGISGFRKIIAANDETAIVAAIEAHITSIMDDAYTSTRVLQQP